MKKHLLLLAALALMPLAGLKAQSTCDTITDEMMPYYDDFEEYSTGAMPPCWVGMGFYPLYPNYPKVNVDNSHSTMIPAGKMLHFYGGRSIDSACYAVMPYMENVNDKIVRMSLLRTNQHPWMDLGVMTDPNDTTTFVMLHRFISCNASGWSSSYWTRHEGSLTSYTGDGHYIAFRTYASYGGNQMFLDSLEVDFAPCDRADSVKVLDISFDTARLVVYDASAANNYHVFFCNTADMVETDFYIDSNVFTLTGLEAGQEYRIVLSTSCPDGDETTPFTVIFRTPCEILTAEDLPIQYTFDDMESGAVFNPVCWNVVNTVPYQSNAIKVGGQNHNEGEGNCLSLRPYQNMYQYVVLPEVENIQSLQMTFYAKGNNNNNLAVAIVDNLANLPTMVPLYEVEHLSNDWTQYMVDFSNYTGEGGRLVIRGGVVYAFDYNIFIDDIELSVMPTCPAPLGVSATNIAQTEATIVINDTASENATYEMTISTADTSWVEIMYQPTLLMTDLAYGTDYSVSVAKLCDDGTVTFPVQTSFKTLCDPIELVPWVVDFESPSDLDCWLIQSYNNFANDNWQRYIDTADNNNDSYVMQAYHYSDAIASNDWLITPGISLAEGATGYTLYYDYQGRVFTGTGAMPRMEVRVSTTDRNDTNAFNNFITIDTADGDTWVSRTFNLDTFAGETIYIAFVRQGTHDLSQRLDNIAIRNFNMPDVEIIAPAEASTEDVTEYIAHMLTNAEGVSYTWTSSMEEAGLAESVKAGDTLRVTYHAEGTDTITLIVNNGIGNDTAIAIVPVYNCAVSELPWNEDFEGYSYSNNAPLAPGCWAVFGFSSYQYYYPNLNSSGGANAGHNSTHCYVVMDAGGSNPHALWILPPFEQPLDTLQVSFYANTSALAITGLGAMEVGYIGSATNPGGFTLISGIGLDTVWQQYTVRMPAEAQGRIAFRVTSGGIVRVDDIVVDIAPEICDAPEVVIDSVTTYSVNFHVPDAEGEVLTVTSYVSDGTTQTQEQVHGSSWAISSLEPGTAYTLYVRHICPSGVISEATEIAFTTLHECTAPEGLSVSNTTATSTLLNWTAVPSATNYTVRVGETTYTANGTSYTLNGLTPETPYTVGVQAHCPSGDSPWSETGFTTERDNSSIGTVSDGLSVNLWPNPATNRVVVSTGAPAHVSVIDISGHTSGEWNTESGELEINVSQMARGAYFVRICTENGTAVVKLIVK